MRCRGATPHADDNTNACTHRYPPTLSLSLCLSTTLLSLSVCHLKHARVCVQQMLENWWYEPATLRSMSGRWDNLEAKLPAEDAAKLQVRPSIHLSICPSGLPIHRTIRIYPSIYPCAAGLLLWSDHSVYRRSGGSREAVPFSPHLWLWMWLCFSRSFTATASPRAADRNTYAVPESTHCIR